MPFVATTSVPKLLLLLLGSAAFAAIGVAMVNHPTRGKESQSIAGGCVAIVFFGLCAIVALGQLIGPRHTLSIDNYGITWTGRSDQTIPWSAITDVNLLRIGRGGTRFLVLGLADPTRYPPAPTSRRSGFLPSTRKDGADVYIQVSMLNASYKQLARALDQYWPPRDG